MRAMPYGDTRRALLRLLLAYERDGTPAPPNAFLALQLDVTVSTISHHLAVARERGYLAPGWGVTPLTDAGKAEAGV